MKIFGRNRDSLRIKKAQATRALFMDGNGTQEIEIRLRTEEGDELALQIPFLLAPVLIGQLTDAYEAIVPPLSRRNNPAAQWGLD